MLACQTQLRRFASQSDAAAAVARFGSEDTNIVTDSTINLTKEPYMDVSRKASF